MTFPGNLTGSQKSSGNGKEVGLAGRDSLAGSREEVAGKKGLLKPDQDPFRIPL